MEELIFTLMVLAVGGAIHAWLVRGAPGWEVRILTASFVLHVVSSFGQVWVTKYYYAYGDMLMYYENGVPIADALWKDFGFIGTELLKTFMQREDAALPFSLSGGGTSASMGAVAAAVLFLVGNSLYAANLLFGVGAYVSKVLIARALQPFFPEDQRRWVLIGALLLPSAAFWSSGMLKEPVVMVVLGPMVMALQWLATSRRTLLALVILGLTGFVLAVIKPYVLMALSLAAGVFYLWTRLSAKGNLALKPFAVVGAGLLATVGLVGGYRLFSKSDVDVAQAFAAQRQAGYATEGGSNFSIEDEPGLVPASQTRTLAQELLLTPFALVTALFRPFLFEARNAVQLANALETTVLLVLVIQTIRRRSWRLLVSQVRDSPVLMFCAVFVLALAIGTGLATTNMGTLSRYRAPMSPFFFILILTLRAGAQPLRREDGAAGPSRVRLA